MTHTTMTTDRAGNALMFEGIRSTCRDLARFGLLMLDRGAWGSRWSRQPLAANRFSRLYLLCAA